MRVDEVARAAGVSPALIYHHFGDRATLLRSALEHVGDRADRYTIPPDGLGRQMVLDLASREIQDDEEVRTNSAAWGELRDTAIFDPSLQPTVARLTRRWIDDIAALVRVGHGDGSIDVGVDPDETGIRVSAVVEGLSGRWLSGMLTTTEARRHVVAVVTSLLDTVASPTR